MPLVHLTPEHVRAIRNCAHALRMKETQPADVIAMADAAADLIAYQLDMQQQMEDATPTDAEIDAMALAALPF